MKKVVLNGVEINVDIDENSLFSELKETLKPHLEDQDKVVTSVKNDGLEVFQNQADACLAKPLNDFGAISITAETLEEISKRLFVNGINFLNKLKEEVLRVSEAFRTKSKEEAFQEFVAYVEGLQSIFELVNVLIKNPQIDFLGTVYDGRTGEIIIKDFTNLNKEVLQAQEGQDLILLADLLEYELSPALENFAGLLGVVSNAPPRAL